MSNIIRRYIDLMKFAAYTAFSFITFLHIFWVPFVIIVYIGCTFCMLLFNFVSSVFLLLCLCILVVIFMFSYCYVMFYSVYSFPLCCSAYYFMCKCVMYCSHRVSTQLQLTNISYYNLYLSQDSYQISPEERIFRVTTCQVFWFAVKVFVLQKAIYVNNRTGRLV